MSKTREHRSAQDGQILIYEDGANRLQVRLDGRTVWLPQRLMAELYQVSVKTVNEHLINIYREDELDADATIRKFRIVQREGSRDVRRTIDHYNLEAVNDYLSRHGYSRTAMSRSDPFVGAK